MSMSDNTEALTDEQILMIGRRALDKCSGTEAQHLYIAREAVRAALAQQAATPAAQAEPPRITGRAAIVDAWNALPNGLRIDPTLSALWRAIGACDDAAAPTPDVQAGDELPTPVGWRDELQRIRDHICAGGLAENMQHERSVVEPYLDAVEDSLAELERAALAARGAQAGLTGDAEIECECLSAWNQQYAEHAEDTVHPMFLTAFKLGYRAALKGQPEGGAA